MGHGGSNKWLYLRSTTTTAALPVRTTEIEIGRGKIFKRKNTLQGFDSKAGSNEEAIPLICRIDSIEC
ncbi:hypothetical protein PanWU01x14_090370 [Parasponia andersonii]|uniref:Uncharacterized protein n=1 Tax=Parasponia andersonii TaxID=3476 RepID=A0A2P5D7Q0_PARAD|nr:hypothetical protein PanWU01x14_090370 [Parasponia andersonii]